MEGGRYGAPPIRKHPEAHAFFRAVCFGTLVAATPGLPLTLFLGLMIAVDEGKVGEGIWMGVWPLAFATLFIFPASLVLGLPTAYILHRMRRESGLAYGLSGALFGAALPLIVFGLEGWSASIVGAIGGLATALFWWNAIEPYRELYIEDAPTTD